MGSNSLTLRLAFAGVLALYAAVSCTVAQPLDPLGSVSTTPRTGVAAQGEHVYCVGNNSFVVVDVSNPSSPEIVGQVTPGVPSLLTLDVHDDYAYCAGGATGLVVIEISDPDAPAWRANLAVAGLARDAAVSDTIIAVATSSNVSLIGVRNPVQPHLLTTFGRASSSVRFNAAGTMIYAGSQTGAFALEVQTIDSAGATRYRLVSAGDYGSQPMTPHDVGGSYVTYARGAEVVALRAANFTLAGSHSVTSAIRAVAAGNGFSFVALATGSLQYLDQRTDSPEFVAAVGVPTTATGLALAHGGGQALIIVSTANGLSVFAYTPVGADDDPRPELPRVLSLAAYPNPFNGSVRLALAVPTAGMYTLEVFDPAGRLVSRGEQFVNGNASTSLDFRGEGAGFYFARLRGAAVSTTTKLLYLP